MVCKSELTQWQFDRTCELVVRETLWLPYLTGVRCGLDDQSLPLLSEYIRRYHCLRTAVSFQCHTFFHTRFLVRHRNAVNLPKNLINNAPNCAFQNISFKIDDLEHFYTKIWTTALFNVCVWSFCPVHFRLNTVHVNLWNRTHLNRLIQFAVSGVQVVLYGFQGVKESFTGVTIMYI